MSVVEESVDFDISKSTEKAGNSKFTPGTDYTCTEGDKLVHTDICEIVMLEKIPKQLLAYKRARQTLARLLR